MLKKWEEEIVSFTFVVIILAFSTFAQTVKNKVKKRVKQMTHFCIFPHTINTSLHIYTKHRVQYCYHIVLVVHYDKKTYLTSIYALLFSYFMLLYQGRSYETKLGLSWKIQSSSWTDSNLIKIGPPIERVKFWVLNLYVTKPFYP